MDYLKLALEKKDEAIETLSKLVEFKSVLDKYNPNSDAPFGSGNKEALNFMLELAKNDGFTTKNVDNYAGHISYGSGEETIGVLGHLDVVPVAGQNWKSDPFKAEIRDGKLYARGSEDDKGPVVAAYYALKILKEQNIKLNKEVRIILGCDEESGSRCLTRYFSQEKMPELGFSPDAEFPVIYGEKAAASYYLNLKEEEGIILDFVCGTRLNIVPATAKMRLSIDLEKEYMEFLKLNNYQGEYKDGYYYAYGVASHAMVPQNGLNAAFILFEFLNKYHKTKISEYFVKYLTFDPFGKKLGINIYDEDMKELTENVGLVNMIDGVLKVGINYRIPVDNYLTRIEDAYSKSFANNSFSFELIDSCNLHYVPKDSFLVQTLLMSYQEITGDVTTEPFTIGGGTYAKFIKNCVAFGPQMPGTPDVCHIADEYIEIDAFVKSIAIILKALCDLGR